VGDGIAILVGRTVCAAGGRNLVLLSGAVDSGVEAAAIGLEALCAAGIVANHQ